MSASAAGTSRLDGILAHLPFPDLDPLVESIISHLESEVPEFAGVHGDLRSATTRLAIERAVDYFACYAWGRRHHREELDEAFRRMGRAEAYDGRTLSPLRAAIAQATTIARHFAQGFGDRGDAPFSLVDEAIAEIVEFASSLEQRAHDGYRDAQSELGHAVERWRTRALDLILAGRTHSEEFTDLVDAAGWAVPAAVTVIAVRPGRDAPLPPVWSLRPDSLSRASGDQPVVLLPAPLNPGTLDEIVSQFAGHRIALGCQVPIRHAASSLRWARRALDLAAGGIIPDEPVVDCADHIGTLWIHSEPLLAGIVNRTLLAPLYEQPPHSRKILGETLLAWIETTRASAPALAEIMGRHPQTIRYRLRRLREIFGDALDEPQRVLEMYYALRSSGPAWNDGKPAPPAPFGRFVTEDGSHGQ